MNSSSAEKQGVRPQTGAVQVYARIGAVLLLISILGGVFGEIYVASKMIVPGDASATANNIRTSGTLFRWGFAAYLLEALCDIGLTWIFYILLRPVHSNLALLAVFFRLISTATFAFAELFYFAVSIILNADYLKTFSLEQVNSLALLALRLYGFGGGIFMLFYGVASILLGYLIFQSGYLPKFIGVLLALAGAAFVTRNFALVLAPTYAYDALLLPMGIAALVLMLWLLIKGVNVPKWEARVAR